MSKELLEYFDFNVDTPTVSAYTQQRSKVLPEIFEYLFQSFTKENISSQNNYKRYMHSPIENLERVNIKEIELTLGELYRAIRNGVAKGSVYDDRSNLSFGLMVYLKKLIREYA